eukprot:scaffold43409_cov35-Prasinocladus_malaysianus.AAC.1
MHGGSVIGRIICSARGMSRSRTPRSHLGVMSAFHSADSAVRVVIDGTMAPMRNHAAAFVYSGQGAQWRGMGVTAYAKHQTFRETIDRLAASANSPGVSEKLRGIFRDGAENDLSSGPALTAYQIAMTNTLREALGIEPRAVVGFSLGEVAAAYAAGALSESEALELSIARTELALLVAPEGSMAVMNTTPGEFDAMCQEADGATECYVACYNSTRSLTVAGPKAAMARLESLVCSLINSTNKITIESLFSARDLSVLLRGCQSLSFGW